MRKLLVDREATSHLPEGTKSAADPTSLPIIILALASLKRATKTDGERWGVHDAHVALSVALSSITRPEGVSRELNCYSIFCRWLIKQKAHSLLSV